MNLINELVNYLDEKGKVKEYPSKRKMKNLCLLYLSAFFETKKIYAESEVNDIINSMTKFNDAATLRREMCGSGILSRKKDCTFYWLEDIMPSLNNEGMFIK